MGTVVSCSSPPETASLRELATELSEEGGYFDTDNLISNETAYVQAIDALEPLGGIYIGVGPEQNFHYIGRLRPAWAFIVDIRPDNQLHHFLLNGVLANAETPYDYLCWLFARRCDGAPGEDDFESLVAAVEAAPADADLFERRLETILEHIENRLEMALNEESRGTIEFIYRSYFEGQLGLRFNSHGRRPQPHHPTYRSLLVAAGPSGRASHFLARRDDYDFVRELAASGRLVPVVGDFAGEKALRGIGAFANEQDEAVTAFYTSNVEFYLIRNGVFPRYVENVRALPLSADSQFIRAYFSYGYPHPQALPGHRSTVVRQKMGRFLELYDDDAFRDFWDVSTMDALP